MSSKQHIRVRFYGRLADVLGPEIEVSTQPCSIAELRGRIAAEHPGAAEALGNGRVRACVSDTIVAEGYRIGAGDEVEFFPPVSGG